MGLKLKTFSPVTVDNAGTRKRLSETSVLVYAVAVQSVRTNTGYQYIGDSSVSSSNGHEFQAADVAEIEPPVGTAGREPSQIDLRDIWVDSTVSGASFRIAGWIRD